MARRSRYLNVLAAAALILVISSHVLATSLINNPDAEAALQRNRELDEYLAESQSLPQLKSPAKAFLFSAIVPGTGELYSKAKRGYIFVAAEAAFWAAYIVIHGRAGELEQEYVSFVDEHIRFESDSPATSTANWTMEDYEHATQSDNWHYVYTESNGHPVDRVGKFYWDDLPEDMIDEPGSQLVSQSRAEAFEKRHLSNDKFEQAKIFIGLVVFNHIASAVDGRIAATIYNNRASKITAEVSLHPTLSPSGHPGAYLALRAQF